MRPTRLPRAFALIFRAREGLCFSGPRRRHRPARAALCRAASRRDDAAVPQWGTRPAIDRVVSGYTPQISQRKAHKTVPSGWQVHMRHGISAQEEEQLWGSR
jgi:hypothetical protein